MTSSEFELIQNYFTGLGEGAAVRLGMGDDAAVLQVPEGHVLQISTDTALEGAHFSGQSSRCGYCLPERDGCCE